MDTNKLLALYPGYYVVLGPYITGGRRHIFLAKHKSFGRRKHIQYARALMEVYLNRRLASTETVDHIDENPLNDKIDNLQILSLPENVGKSNRLKGRGKKGTSKYGASTDDMKEYHRTWYEANKKEHNRKAMERYYKRKGN